MLYFIIYSFAAVGMTVTSIFIYMYYEEHKNNRRYELISAVARDVISRLEIDYKIKKRKP